MITAAYLMRPLAAALIVFACIHHTAQAAGCRYNKFASMPVQLHGSRVVLDGSINGKPLSMMIDTGSEETWIPRKTAEDLLLKLRHFDGNMMGTGGESQLYSTLIDDIEIGKAHWQRVNLNVVWDAVFPFGAVVGANFLFQNDVEFDLAGKEIRFFQPEGCDSSFLGYWDNNAIVVPFEQALPRDLRATVEVVINGQKLRALIDSGAPSTTIDLAAAAQLGVTPQSPGVTAKGKITGVGKHDNDAWLAPFDSFAIGEETINHPKIMMVDLYGSFYKDEQKL